MRNTLLLLAIGWIGTAGCGSQPDPQAGARSADVDTIIRYTRDTIIKHQAAGARDTIIKYYGAAPECCDQVPRPPDCPPLLQAMRVDTIIK
jgi:hypothetical protein